MPWAGGTFTRTNGTYSGAAVWQSDAAAAIKIRADRHDTHDQDLAQGINNTLTKDGQNSPNQHISWGGFKITSLGNGAAAGDAVNKGQMDAGDTAANANANTRVLKAGDTMTGPLVNDHSGASNNYVNSTRSGFGYAWFNLGDGNHGLFDATAAANAWNYATAGGGVHTFRGSAAYTGNVTTSALFASQRADNNFAYQLQTAGASLRGGLWMRADGISLVNVLAPGGFRELFLNNNGNLEYGAALVLGGGFGVTSITVSSSAPGALAQGQIYFRY